MMNIGAITSQNCGHALPQKNETLKVMIEKHKLSNILCLPSEALSEKVTEAINRFLTHYI